MTVSRPATDPQPALDLRNAFSKSKLPCSTNKCLRRRKHGCGVAKQRACAHTARAAKRRAPRNAAERLPLSCKKTKFFAAPESWLFLGVLLSETVCGVRRRALGGRSAGRVPHSPPQVRQIKRCGGTDKIGRFFCPIASGRTNTILPSGTRRCRKRAHCDWALVAPLHSAGPHSDTSRDPPCHPPHCDATALPRFPLGHLPRSSFFVWLGFLPGFRLGYLRPVRLRPSMLRLLLLRGVP